MYVTYANVFVTCLLDIGCICNRIELFAPYCMVEGETMALKTVTENKQPSYRWQPI